MSWFVARRFVNYLVLVLAAICLGYFLAASSLNPRARFEERNPPPPPAVVDQTLSELNLNDKTPLISRFVTWAGGVAHGDLGRTVDGDPVVVEMSQRMG